jgi:hypothetical protein
MSTRVNARTSVFPSRGVKITFNQGLEVSLDCAHCGRTHRTVVFGPAGEPGRCTPTGHAYSGQIGEIKVQEKGGLFQSAEVECSIPLVYEYFPVKDSKYPNRISNPIPSWGRVGFKVTCPKCKQTSEHSIQNNTVRPWTCVCDCGYALYEERQPYLTFQRRKAMPNPSIERTSYGWLRHPQAASHVKR